MISTFDIFVKI